MTGANAAAEPRHPIGLVAERTGLSQDVLRVWERRYGAVTPGRGNGGQRLYSDVDIERLRLLAIATAAGRNIGQVAALATPALRSLIEEVAGPSAARPADPRSDPSATTALIDRAVDLARAFDVPALDLALRRSIAVEGIHHFVDAVAPRLLRRIGDEWEMGRMTPGQEHLASAVVQRIALAAVQGLPAAPGGQRLVIGTLPGDRHALGAVLAGAAAAVDGWHVVQLGAELSGEEIAAVALATNAAAVAVSAVYATDRGALLHELRSLRDRLPASVPLFVGGDGALRAGSEIGDAGAVVVKSLGEFRERLHEVAGAPGLVAKPEP